MALDIGAEAIDRGATQSGNLTIIAKENPCNGNGKIDTVEIWAAAALSDVEVATFYKTDTNTFSTRDNQAIGTVPSGSKQSYSVDLDVQVGDYIGIYSSAGLLEKDNSGEGIWALVGDTIPCTQTAFEFSVDRTISLKGTGQEVAVGGSRGFIIG